MKVIQFRVTYTGATGRPGTTMHGSGLASHEIVTVRARNINAGYLKTLRRALEPLGNGHQREVGAIEFWQVV